jgi:hypothetical protein
MLFREIVVSYAENLTKHINTYTVGVKYRYMLSIDMGGDLYTVHTS